MKWTAVVVVAIPIILLGASESLSQVSGCTQEEIIKLKKAFRKDRQYLQEHNRLLGQQKDELVDELRNVKADLSEYKETLQKERDDFSDLCPRFAKRNFTSHQSSSKKLQKVLARVKVFSQHQKEKIARKEKEITKLKKSIEDSADREKDLHNLIARLKASCKTQKGSNIFETRYQAKPKEDDLDDLMNNILGESKSETRHREEHVPAREGSDRGDRRKDRYGHKETGRVGDRFSHREGERTGDRYGHREAERPRARGRGDDRRLGTSDLLSTLRSRDNERDRGHRKDGSRLEDGDRKKSEEGHKDYAGHGFGQWPEENNYGFGPFVEPDKKTGKGEKERHGADREQAQDGDNRGRHGGKQRHHRIGDDNNGTPNDRKPIMDPQMFPEGHDTGRNRLPPDVLEARKHIKVTFGDSMQHKELNKGDRPKDKGGSKTPVNKSVEAEATNGTASADKNAKTNEGHGNKTRDVGEGLGEKPAHPDASIQSLSGQNQGVTVVKKGAMRNFKMTLPLNATQEITGSKGKGKNKDGKKKGKGTKNATTTKKP